VRAEARRDHAESALRNIASVLNRNLSPANKVKAVEKVLNEYGE
jgi:hypothetical protein